MLIKYKGNTSNLLKDLSLELKIPINLKVSETILLIFFDKVLRSLSAEESIQLISLLPPGIKPFCAKMKINEAHKINYFHSCKYKQTKQAIINTLIKYSANAHALKMIADIPDNIITEACSAKKEPCIAA